MMFNKRLIAMVPEAKRLIIRKILVNWLSLLAGIVMWFVIAGLLDGILEHGVVQNEVLMAFGIAVVCVLIRFFLTKVMTKITANIAAFVKTHLRDNIYAKLRKLGSGYTDKFPTSEVVQLAGDGVEQLESYFGNYLPQFVYALLAPFTLLLVFLPLSWQTAIALFLCVPLIPIAIVGVQNFAKRLLAKYWASYANLGNSFLENLQGLTTLKVYGADEARHKFMNEESEHFRVVTMKVLTMQLNSVTIMDLVAYGGTALGSIFAALSFSKGQVSIGGAIAMIMLASEFFLAMRALGSYFHVAMNGMAACDRMFELMDIPDREYGKKAAQNGDITVKNLNFSYDGQRKALDSVSFQVKKGQFVSICGESGCGKSTFASLLSGKRSGYEGSIRLNGTELSDLEGRSLRDLITVVSSNSYLFGGTVRQTLLEGKPDATEAEMWKTLERVNLKDFVEVQGGLDLVLQDRASNISGGQRQRLALARALMKNSPIYVFDEATSNIDVESEENILSVIHSLRGQHTILMISHRLSNGVGCDEIEFMEHGKLRESGTHAELLRKNGGYATLFHAQQALENMGKEMA